MQIKFNIYHKVLALLLLLSLLPLITLGLLSYRHAHQSLKQNIGYRVENLAQSAMKDIDHQLVHYIHELQNLAKLEVMQDVLTTDTSNRINSKLSNFKKSSPFYHQLNCINKKGKIIASSKPDLIGKTYADAKYFKQAIASQSYISDIKLSDNGKPVITFSTPIRLMDNQDKIIGVLASVLDWEHFYHLLENIKIDWEIEEQIKEAHIMLIDRNGLVIFAPKFERPQGGVLRDNLFDMNVLSPDFHRKKQFGYLVQQDEHKQMSLIGYARSGRHGHEEYADIGWTALALHNLEQALLPIERLRDFILLIFVILALGAILTARLFARRLTSGIKSLTQATRHIAEQVARPDAEFTEDIPIKSSDEIGELTESFNLMKTELTRVKKKLGEEQEKLKVSNNELQNTNEQLEYIINEIHRVLEDAVEEQSFKVRFHNPELINCWEEMQCNSTDCPAYESKYQRCWHVAGTFCQGKVQGLFAQKLGDCRKCKVYRKAVTTKLYAIGEVFNDMMELLEDKNQQVKDYANNLEIKVKKRTAELEQANQELRQTHEQLLHQERLASLGQLAAGVSHELKSPIWGILGLSQHLLEIMRNSEATENMHDDITNLLTQIEKGAKKCETVVKNMLNFSHASRSEEFKSTNLNQLLEDTLLFTKHQLQVNRVVVKKEFSSNLPQINGNKDQLQQVFTNLILNAQQAMPEGGRLNVSTKLNNGQVEVIFADTGCGISEENLANIFDPFFTTKPVDQGTGLGLSISSGIIQEHTGELLVQSTPGEGSKFTIRLPIEENQAV